MKVVLKVEPLAGERHQDCRQDQRADRGHSTQPIRGHRQAGAVEGAVIGFTRSGTVWTQQGDKLVGTGARTNPSEIDNNVALRLGTTDQHIAGRRWIDRVGPVGNRSGNKPGFTGVTDSRTARPPRGDVTRFGKLKEAVKRRTPMDIQATAGERNQRPRPGGPGRQMRRLARGGANAWGNGWA